MDIEVIKAIAALLRGLPLQDGNGGVNVDSNLAAERKKSKFVKYFTFFTKLLSRCKEEVSILILNVIITILFSLVMFLLTDDGCFAVERCQKDRTWYTC